MPAGEVERILHPVDLRGVLQPAHVRVEPEAGRPLRRRVAARALEHAAAVVDDVRGDVNRRVLPLDQLAVHPDLAGSRKSHRALLTSDSSVSVCGRGYAAHSEIGPVAPSISQIQRAAVYCASPQNGQRSERAWSGLRQCQQKRGCGVSRAFRRLWISCTSSDAARPARRRASIAACASPRRRARPAHRRAARRRAGSARGSRAPSP